MTGYDLYAILPLAILLTWAVLLLVADLWIPADRKGMTAWLTAFGLAIAFGLNLVPIYDYQPVFGGMVIVDGFTKILSSFFILSGFGALALAYDYLKRMNIERGEYYPLLLFSISGMVLMAHANNLLLVFLALELLSIPLYLLCGFIRLGAASEESALKYFLMGTFASATSIYGIAMVFGATGSISLPTILASVSSGLANPQLLIVGAGLMLVGFGFKIGVIPFSMWIPDVYQGAPTSVTGFMSFGAKAAGFAALLRVFVTIFADVSADISLIVWIIAALTMVVGNVIAMIQTNMKRMLAYSSIAHSGYMLIAFVSYGNGEILSDSIGSILFYLISYGIATFGVWAVVIALEKSDGSGLALEDYAGLGERYPWLAVPMMIFMLSFTGIPLTLGFWGKFYLFRTAVESGFLPLALVGVLASLLSAYYYLRVIVIMFMRVGKPVVRQEMWLKFLAIGAALALVILGLVPNSLLNLVLQASINLQ